MRIKAIHVFMLALLCAGAVAYADGEDEATGFEARHQGFYYAFPAYFYGTKSASGAQLGWQLGNLHLRLDVSLGGGTQDGESTGFANPSVGIFYSEDWESKIRTYQGVAIGVQKGIWNSFEGVSYFFSFLAGAEWFVFERKAVYLEIGSGMAAPVKDGAFEGGTVFGGGIKCFL